VLTCKSLFGLGYRGERLIEPSALVVDRAGGILPTDERPGSSLAFCKKAGRHRQIAGKPRGVSFSRRHGRAVPPDHAPRGAPGTTAKAAGMVTSREAPGDIGSQRRRFYSTRGTVAVQRLDGGGSPNARSFGRPKVQSVPPERGPAGGRGEGFLPPPLRARRGRVQQVVSMLRVDPRCLLVWGRGRELFSLFSLPSSSLSLLLQGA
jgi:hypothetical protein